MKPTVSGSTNKGKMEDNEALYDPYPGFTANSLFTEIPWPEWNDADLNAETWTEPKAGKETGVGPKTGGPSLTSEAVFEDPDPPKLPPAVLDCVYSWKRPQEVFQDATLTVFDPTNSGFEFCMPSCVTPECDFFIAFMEELPILQYYAFGNIFSVELETPTYVANTQGESWRPWHHIYAMCKAGKGQVHKPLYCPFGKYILRLFYMGIWRKFVVDDKIPCDIDGNCMLPITLVPGELWPIILMKGLLKIVSRTPSDNFFATDFPLLCALTGWTHANFNAINKTSNQVWRRLLGLIPRFEPPESQCEKDKEESKSPSIKNTNSEKGEASTEKFCFLLGNLKDVPFDENIFQNCSVAVTMTRDCPLVKVNRREGTKPWKRIRWIYWAKEKGIWMDENELPPFRHLQIITFYHELKAILSSDPKLEAALYDVSIEPEDEFSNQEYDNCNAEQWCDYLKFLKYLVRVQVFFKPSFFSFNFTVTCLKEKPVEVQSGGKNTSKVVMPSQNLFNFPPVLKLTCNEPIFIFCESLTGIYLFISLWVCPQEAKNCLGYLEEDQPKFLKIGHGSFVIENFDWRSFEQGSIISLSKTVGYSAVGLSLKPGRHILRLWLDTDSPYVINMYSNVAVTVQKSFKIRSLMTVESQRILNYINNVSNAFIALSLKFGKPDLPEALNEFYDVIKPGHDGMVGYYRKLDDFIECFLKCILLSLKELIPFADELKIMMWALQSLFFNPEIKCDLPPGGTNGPLFGGTTAKKTANKPVVVVPERTLSEILNYIWLPEEIAKIIMIQKVFRGFRVRLLWKYQTPARKEFKPFTDRLKKICDLMFAPSKRELEVGRLLRKIIIQPDLLYTFKFYEDFSRVTQVDEYSGKIPNVEPFAWVPIARFVIACHSQELVPCAFYLSCNLEQCVIQGFDNDTSEEIFRLTNAVSPHYYYSNVKGYTIFVFGWNESNFKTVNWKLEMVKMKHFEVIHLCNILMFSTCHPYPMPNLEVFDIKNVYVPNSKSRICRCLIKIQKQTILTFRITSSYSDVEFVVVVSLDRRFLALGPESDPLDGVVVKVKSTNGSVMVSSVVLEPSENFMWDESYPYSNETIYILEAFVVNNSWPLTRQEWGLVEPIRMNLEASKDSKISLQKKGSESRRKISRTSKRSMSEQKVVDSPSWLLQVLNDSAGSELGEQIIVEEDKSYAEYIKLVKMSWEEKDPGRKYRGGELRTQFLHAIYLENKQHEIIAEEDYDGGDGSGDSFSDPQAILHRLSSFSYLLNDPSPVRYTYSPRILPVTPMCDLIYKYRKFSESLDSKKSSFNNSSDDVTEVSSKAAPLIVDELENERKDFLDLCSHFRSVMTNYITDEAKLSCQLMEEAYEGRSRSIERMVRMAN